MKAQTTLLRGISTSLAVRVGVPLSPLLLGRVLALSVRTPVVQCEIQACAVEYQR